MDDYKQPEAFCLMRYRSESGREFVIWNSRAHVTPFMVDIDGEEFKHVDWRSDTPAPNHVPKIGDYVFIDLTIDRAVAMKAEWVRRYWDAPENPMRDHGAWKTEHDAVWDLAQSDVASFGGHSPDMIKADAAFLSGLLAGRRNAADAAGRKPTRQRWA